MRNQSPAKLALAKRNPAALLTLALAWCGCGDSLSNLTASLGGQVAGDRGTFRVLFINNTTFRAVFTAGAFDQTDRLSAPDITQFGPDEDDPTLDGDARSDILELDCGRVFAIGSPRLLSFLDANAADEALIEKALVNGVDFYEIGEADSQQEPRGSAPPFEALLGVDFPCNALLIIRFEPSDSGPEAFRVDFELVPSESTR